MSSLSKVKYPWKMVYALMTKILVFYTNNNIVKNYLHIIMLCFAYLMLFTLWLENASVIIRLNPMETKYIPIKYIVNKYLTYVKFEIHKF